MNAREAAERLRDEPAHYFDCDRFQVYDYGTRQGTCDCTHGADVDALTATVDRVRELVALPDPYVTPVYQPYAVHIGDHIHMAVLVDDLRAALDGKEAPDA